MVELRHLRYFVAVAEELHFGRAAQRLNMSQPPLSQQIKALEDALGAELFRRTNRSVTLTRAGRDLYEQIVPWLGELSTISARVRRIGEGEQGQLTVACGFSTTQFLVPRVITAFRERYPDVAIKLREMSVERQVESLGKGLIDLGFMRLPVDESNLEVSPLYDESLMVALPAGHALASRRRLALADLKDEVFLNATSKSAALFESIEAVCLRAGFEAKVINITSNLNTAMGLVGVGLGLALVPESMRESAPRSLACRPLRDSPRSTVALAWRRDDDSPVVKLFVETARRLASAPDFAKWRDD